MAEKKVQKRVPGYKSENQKYKSLLVMQYILKCADDEHPVTIADIEAHLLKYGIEAERRSIYRDIHDLMNLMNAELAECVNSARFLSENQERNLRSTGWTVVQELKNPNM